MFVSLLLALLLISKPLADALYAPIPTTCPATPLVRDAKGLSDSEEAYRVARKAVADQALKSWLLKTNPEFGTSNLPTIALTTSGGGYRSLLLGAGVVQTFDSRDSSSSTSGLYQALTYHAGLSGGGWMLSSIAGNNFPTISYLKNNLWKQAFQNGPLHPGNFLQSLVNYAEVGSDVLEKEAAGFDTTLTDPYGRLLSFQFLSGRGGGVATTMSGLTSFSNMTSHLAPIPIITSLGAKVWLGECTPGPNATTYEFTPFEFGSWDSDVSAFTPTKYLGTTMRGGKAVGQCTARYDNLGYILATSSNLFNELCLNHPPPMISNTNLATTLVKIIGKIHTVTNSDLYATYRNPFYQYKSSSGIVNSANNVAAQESLALVDGGEALQNNPIFPLLQPSRNISVIIVNDNSADTPANYPNGSEILTTYVQSKNHGYARMPLIPSVDTFIALGLNKRATFFGCNSTDKITIVYLPNYNFTFASGVATSQLEYSASETDAMIANGNQVGNQGGEISWASCLGCALMMKTGQKLPTICTLCFEAYCYYGS